MSKGQIMQGGWSVLRILDFILRRITSHYKLLSKGITLLDLSSQRPLWLLCGKSIRGGGKNGKWSITALAQGEIVAAWTPGIAQR